MTSHQPATTAGPAAATPDAPPRVAIAHDWLVRYAGSERCVAELLLAFPGAEVLTTLVAPDELPEPLRRAKPSMLQRLPGATSHHEWLLPLMPLAWRTMPPPSGVDAVVSSSHACAKAVRLEPGTPHLCYCHTPMRYAWDFAAEQERFPRATRTVARGMMAWFRRWDRASAANVTRFMANSRAVAGRIERFYGRRAQVVPPPVRTDYFTPGGERGDGFLYVGRLNGYKRPDLVVEAFRDLPHPLTVVGEGAMGPALRARATANVSFRARVTDEELRDLYRSARAMVYPVDEDFGIVMAEAQACGTPVISIDSGGALDIVEPGVTGWLMRGRGVADLEQAVRRAAVEPLDAAEIRARAERFSAESYRAALRAAVEEMVEDPCPV
jgi:glycosyltransferase involved in cell wall biosynthesis